MEIFEMTAREMAAGLEAGRFSSEEAVRSCLKRAETVSSRTGSFVETYGEAALAEARESDSRRRKGEIRSVLDGVPFAVKDNMMVAGRKVEAASAMLLGHVSAYDATAVRRMREAGAVLLGRTNMDEFAMGTSTETSVHGLTRNPWDLERIPGGSSGGSAAAVAELSVPIALGSDTGGSIRQPAAMCGTVGMKPTYGRVSRYGLISMASSLDQIGPLARTAEDAALALGIIEGWDGKDANAVRLKPEWGLPAGRPESLKGVRIGLPKEGDGDGMDPEVREAVRKSVEDLKALGAETVEVSLPNLHRSLAVYYVLVPSEVSSNLARFDGIRYGNRIGGETLTESYVRTRGQGLGPEVRRRIMVGTFTLSSGHYDEYYRKALEVRQLIADDFRQAFSACDLIATPVSPSVAWPFGEKSDPLSLYLADIYTVPANLAGLPSVSLPCGLSAGLPVGLQLTGRQFADGAVLAAAMAYESRRGAFPSPSL